MSRAQPFPFASLPAYSRVDVAAGARVRRIAAAWIRFDAFADVANQIFGADLHVTLRDVRRTQTPRGADDAIGVLFARAGEHAPARRVLVEVPGVLATALAARAIRHKVPRVLDPSRPVSPVTAGAFAAVLGVLARRATNGAPLQILAAGPGAVLARDLAASAGSSSTASLTTTLDGETFEVQVTVPDGVVGPSDSSAWNTATLAALGDMPIALPIVVAETLASRMTLLSLAPGDAFLPSGCSLTVADAQVGTTALVGPVVLLAARAEAGVRADLAPSGQLVVRGLLENHPWDGAATMSNPTDGTNANVTLQAVEDAPVVVRVELGAVEMTARAWAELAAGDVVTLGRKLGDHAILRVAGVEVARGELVQVDGEIAVKIVSRAGGDGG